MQGPKKDPKKDLDKLRQEVEHFNFAASLKEQKEEIKRIAQQIQKINNELPLGRVVELGNDGVALATCAVNPIDILGCIGAFFAVIDLIKLASRKKIK